MALAGASLLVPYQGSGEEPPEIESLLSAGEKALEGGDLKEALNHFNLALELDRKRAKTWNYLGGIHFRRGDYSKALLHFKQALTIDPRDARASNNIGSAYEHLGNYGSAEEYYLKAIGIEESYPVPYRNLGILYVSRMNKPDLARSFWTRYLALVPGGADADVIREKLQNLKAPDDDSTE